MEIHNWQKGVIAALAFFYGSSSIALGIGSVADPAEALGYVFGAYFGSAAVFLLLGVVVIYSSRKTRALFGRVRSQVA